LLPDATLPIGILALLRIEEKKYEEREEKEGEEKCRIPPIFYQIIFVACDGRGC